MSRSQSDTARVRGHFRKTAFSFDALYDEDRLLQRSARPALFRRRDLALEVVRSYEAPRVLDVGCGSGRIGEPVLEAGACEYVGIDFSEPMIELAQRRLERFGERVTLVTGDFLEESLEGPFEVVLGLGLFDYLPQPEIFAARMRELCSGGLVASFPRWSPIKGPVRKLRYEVINDCPIFDYSPEDVRELFASAGFSQVRLTEIGRSAVLAHAEV
jgi:2-polyprenyl-3-methyl-5-hydroxy-6-metoxy-1,4-benzoquinol methylase